MSWGKQNTSISIPEYQKPTPSSFNTPWGSANYSGNSWNVNANEQATINQASQIRSGLLNSLGLGGNISQDAYTKEYMNELLRLAQPRTENALIGRGLGGSTVYKDALTDLITKASSQAILGGQQYKQNDLSMLSGYLDNQYNMGNQLAQLAAQTGLSEEQMYNQRYQALLPYLTQVNTPKQSGLMGALTGGGLGFLVGGPVGAVTGAASGYYNSATPASSTPYILSDAYSKKSSPLQLQELLKLSGAF